VDRCTITRAVREVRPLLAARGFAVPGRPDARLRTLADVFAYAAAEGVELRLDGTEKGRTLWAGAFRPGRMHDQTAVKTLDRQVCAPELASKQNPVPPNGTDSFMSEIGAQPRATAWDWAQ
jgi:hypothetical protein